MTIQAQILELMKELTRRLSVALTIITHSLPRHPYTLALLRSVPRLDRPRQARLDPVEGQPPDLTRLDPGCSFRPRYRFAVADCALTQPPLEPAGDAKHLAVCFRSREITLETAAPSPLQTVSG